MAGKTVWQMNIVAGNNNNFGYNYEVNIVSDNIYPFRKDPSTARVFKLLFFFSCLTIIPIKCNISYRYGYMDDIFTYKSSSCVDNCMV